jgi:hypothetical protein
MRLAAARSLSVPAPRGHLAQLAAEREAFRERIGGDDGVSAAGEGVGEDIGVSRSAGELDGLPAQRVAAIPRALVAKRPRETGQKSGPELQIALWQRGQPFLEQRHEPIVGPGAHPDDPPPVAGGCAREFAG